MVNLLPGTSIRAVRAALRPPNRKRGKGSKKPTLFRLLIKRLWQTAFILLLFLVGTIVMLRFIDPPLWSVRVQRAMSPPAGYPETIKHEWCDLEEIPYDMQLAVVASEDQNFPNHSGIDLGAIEKALTEAEQGAGLRGASTITQQTVKNLFLWQGKNWSRKALEGALSLLVELLWEKQRILEVYLNIAEYGPGVYGVCAGSEYWYGSPVSHLSRNQAARLVAVLPSPWRYRAQPPTPYISERARWIEQQMDMLGDDWLRSVHNR
ncbi:MAG: monofunctional biosynthetic peptidoglycan transglycosylase [Candidatus Thiodiazotropha sp. (ex Myrtea sp. 'scaly one' KF741663)]|nr:monofunctional biosynthetic peptidoglycan transglycosylase [Candidatus Thiodiazotropha sp. (ex Myrtea sp. 'scaly one' KF741663)]